MDAMSRLPKAMLFSFAGEKGVCGERIIGVDVESGVGQMSIIPITVCQRSLHDL
jgi:hypothetical protein